MSNAKILIVDDEPIIVNTVRAYLEPEGYTVYTAADGPADIMLGFEPKEYGIMDVPPKPLQEPILARLGLSLIGVIGISSAIAGLLLFGYFLQRTGNEAMGRSYVFATFAVNSMVYIFAYRSMRRSIFRCGNIMRNKPLVVSVATGLLLAFIAFLVPPIRDLLKLVPLSWGQWGLVFGVALFLLVVVEVGKFMSNRRHPATSPVLGESFERKPI